MIQQSRGRAGFSATIDPLDLPTVVFNLRIALLSMRSLQKSHVELREQYLDGLAEAIVLDKHPHLQKKENVGSLYHLTEKQVEHLIKREQCHRMYKSSDLALLDPSHSLGGISRIDIPATDTFEPFPIGPDPKSWSCPWRSVTDPTIISQQIRSANLCQYNQAEATPFGSGQLANLMGPFADSSPAVALLSGMLPPNVELPLKETQTILSNLSRPLSLAPQTILSELSPDQFRSTYKKVKENTSSSPSGRHAGHYKVVVEDSCLCQLHASMMSIPYLTGFSPIRWRSVVDVMLEKTKGEPKIQHLRIIVLLKRDFNQVIEFSLQDSSVCIWKTTSCVP